MVMGSLNGWLGFCFLAYVFFIPALNILCVPIVWLGIYKGWFEIGIWRKYLIANGFIYVFVFWAIYFVVSDVNTKLKYNVSLYEHIPTYVMAAGITFQGIYFLIWLVNRLRNKELSDSFYGSWGSGFSLLYLLPFIIHMIIGI